MKQSLVWLGASAILLAVSGTASAGAQQSEPHLLLVPAGDTVYARLTQPPAFGFVVYRRTMAASGADAPVRLTSTPMLRPRDPHQVAAIIGPELQRVMRALSAADEVQLSRRLVYDRFTAGVLAVTTPSVARALGEEFIDTTARRGALYEYRVVFTDIAGRETKQSLAREVRVVDASPVPPTALRATPAARQMLVTWSYPAVRLDSGDAVTAFHLYRREAADSAASPRLLTTVVRLEGAPREYRDADVRPGIAYTYFMRAVDILGREGPPSIGARVTMQDRSPLSAPADLVALPGDGLVRLAWRMSPEARVAGYRVERSGALDQPYRSVARGISVAQPSWTDTSVTYGHQYYYRIVALDSTGMASPPSTAIPAVPEDHTPPLAPAGVTVALRGHRAAVSWSASTSNDVAGYYVYRGEDTSHLSRLNALPVPATTFVDSGFGSRGLVPGRSYVVRVTAVDRARNESAPTRWSRIVVPDDEPPASPTAFHVSAVDGRYVELSWSPSPSLDVRTYEARRLEQGAPVITKAAPTAGPTAKLVGVADVRQVRTLRDTTAVHGHRYRYALVAVDSAGNRSVAAIDSVAFRNPTPPPATRFVQARVLSGGIEIRWEPVVDRELAGYLVFRASVPSGVPSQVSRTPVVGTAYTDATGSPDAYYTVRAVDVSGNESSASTPVQPVRASVPVRPSAKTGGKAP